MIRLALLATLALGSCATAETTSAPPHPDAPAYAENMGVSREEADRRLARQEETGAMQERLRPDPNFAGMFIEHQPNYRVVVLFTGDDPTARLRRYTTDPLYVAQPAERTEATLVQTQETLMNAISAARIYVMGSSTDIKANTVSIDVVERRAFQSAASRAGIQIPDWVRIVEHGGIVAEPQARGAVTNFPQARFPAGGAMAALGHGRLNVVNGCLRLGEGAEAPLLIWPSSAVLEGEGNSVRVRDSVSGSVVTVGEVIEVGGGNSPSVEGAFLTGPIPPTCPGPYFIASSEWRPARP